MSAETSCTSSPAHVVYSTLPISLTVTSYLMEKLFGEFCEESVKKQLHE